MIKVILMLIFSICSGTGGEIAVTYGMKKIGGPESFRPRALLRFLWRAVRSGWVWFALPLLAASFYSLLILLSWAPISLVIPASAANYIVGVLGAKYILKEEVTARRWLGVGMVFVGVILVLATG
jgi:multidrug transporter EmrE-like cation transporter